MGAFWESLGDISRTEMHALFRIYLLLWSLVLLVFIIVVVVIIIIIIIIITTTTATIYNSTLYSTKAKRKKEKDCTTYDVKVVCLTMEI